MPDTARMGRRLLGGALILFALGSAAYVAFGPAAESGTAPAAGAQSIQKAALVVYFFDQGKDCVTCDQIPRYAQETLDSYFAPERASGAVVWQVIDVDAPENGHYVDDYALYTKSIVIVCPSRGTWKNLEGVWDRVYDREAFMAYIRDEVALMLSECP